MERHSDRSVKIHKEFPTEKWWRGFKARHRNQLRTNIKPDKIDRGRASVCVENVRDWWRMCHNLLEQLGVMQLPHRLHNVDESGYFNNFRHYLLHLHTYLYLPIYI